MRDSESHGGLKKSVENRWICIVRENVLSRHVLMRLCYLLEGELQFTSIVRGDNLNRLFALFRCQKIAWKKLGHMFYLGSGKLVLCI